MEFRISYAQNREDFLIDGFFPDVTVGHYVDVGAAHPTELSVTKLFYDRGWSGINIEPIPDLVALLEADRPRDLNLKVGVGTAEDVSQFRQYAGSGLSTMSPEMIEAYATRDTPDTAEFVDIEIQVTTLATVLGEHQLPHIHFLKIDVEGSEYDVLSGNDWDQFRPELICIETDHMVRDWTPLLRAARYEQVFHDGLNAYYLAAESRDRAHHFSYSRAVLEAPVLVRPEVGGQLSLVDDLSERVKVLTQQVQTLTARVAEMDDRNNQLAEREAQVTAERQRLAERVAELTVECNQMANDIELRDLALATEKSVNSLYAAREAEVTARLNAVEAHFAEIIGSQSWRYTYPIRRFFEILRARLPRRVLAFAWRRVRPAIHAARATPIGTGELSPEASAIQERLRALADVEGPA